MTRDLYVRMKSSLRNSPRLSFKLIGDDELTGDAGGWEQVERKLRRPGIIWTKQPLRVYRLPLRLDGFGPTESQSIETQIRTLTTWCRPSSIGGGIVFPPSIKLSGNVRVPLSVRWVITDIKWGDFLTNDNGRRFRQDVTITLTEYVVLGRKGYTAALKKALK